MNNGVDSASKRLARGGTREIGRYELILWMKADRNHCGTKSRLQRSWGKQCGNDKIRRRLFRQVFNNEKLPLRLARKRLFRKKDRNSASDGWLAMLRKIFPLFASSLHARRLLDSMDLRSNEPRERDSKKDRFGAFRVIDILPEEATA